MKLKTAKLNLIVGAFFVINILALPALSTNGMAAGAEAGAAAGAAKAGAAGGAATAAGITTGTIAAGAVIAAAAALVIATSGGASQAAIAVPGAQQATQNLQNNTIPATQAATSSALVALNSTETANLAAAAPAVLGGGKTFGGVTLGAALDGVTIAQLQGATVPLDVTQLDAYLAGLKTANLTAYNELVALLKSIAARNSTTALEGLTNLAKAVEADKTSGAATAVSGVLAEAASNYVATMNTLLTTLHPGFIVTTTHHGNNIFTTVLHK